MSIRETLLVAASLPVEQLKRELVELPELGEGVSVYVRAMTGNERDQWEDEHRKAKYRHKEFRSRIAVATVCDSTGALVFSESDAAALNNMNAAALDRIADVAMELSGMGPHSAVLAEKNSLAANGSDSHSD